MGKAVRKTIITAAVTGAIHTPTMSPYLPVTPQELIEDILSVHEAGGAVAHLHVRDPQTGMPNADQDIYREVVSEVKRRCDIVLCTTTGGKLGEPVENRSRVVANLQPELASLNAGSLNFALFHVAKQHQQWKHSWEKDYLAGTEDFIFPNSFYTMRRFLEIMGENGTKPEFEIYDVGMINNLAHLIQAGHVKKPVYLQFVMGILGGIPATVDNLVYMVQTAQHQIGDFQWSVCAAGRFQFPMTTHALLMGGHARVGLEDNLYLEKGVLAKSSGEQVAKLIRIARELGVEPATPAEARGILGLKGLDKVNY
ncbi:MAG: 3-keto-5-aminohexanoate cleavage protein [Proteobacteria bacterium]|nr:3-keto-5-aminohexanoate cleavage protein [Pseudomonadota bacterium]MBU2518148.1 3-keto-5-aminohexanoate cleavage protein [Pseudomonadota bacterium]